MNAANIEAHGGVKLERAAAGGGFRVAEHDADLLANLVDEDEAGARLGDDGGELAQRLRHQARLQAHGGIAHVAFDFGLGHERGDRVHDDHVYAAGANQRFGDFQRLFAMVGLGDEQVIHVHAELARVNGIERMFGVDEGRHAAHFLGFSDGVQREGCFAAGFRSVDFNHAAARQATHAERGIQRKRARGHARHRD